MESTEQNPESGATPSATDGRWSFLKISGRKLVIIINIVLLLIVLAAIVVVSIELARSRTTGRCRLLSGPPSRSKPTVVHDSTNNALVRSSSYAHLYGNRTLNLRHGFLDLKLDRIEFIDSPERGGKLLVMHHEDCADLEFNVDYVDKEQTIYLFFRRSIFYVDSGDYPIQIKCSSQEHLLWPLDRRYSCLQQMVLSCSTAEFGDLVAQITFNQLEIELYGDSELTSRNKFSLDPKGAC